MKRLVANFILGATAACQMAVAQSQAAPQQPAPSRYADFLSDDAPIAPKKATDTPNRYADFLSNVSDDTTNPQVPAVGNQSMTQAVPQGTVARPGECIANKGDFFAFVLPGDPASNVRITLPDGSAFVATVQNKSGKVTMPKDQRDYLGQGKDGAQVVREFSDDARGAVFVCTTPVGPDGQYLADTRPSWFHRHFQMGDNPSAVVLTEWPLIIHYRVFNGGTYYNAEGPDVYLGVKGPSSSQVATRPVAAPASHAAAAPSPHVGSAKK